MGDDQDMVISQELDGIYTMVYSVLYYDFGDNYTILHHDIWDITKVCVNIYLYLWEMFMVRVI